MFGCMYICMLLCRSVLGLQDMQLIHVQLILCPKEVLYSVLQVFQDMNVECSEYLELNDDHTDYVEL